MTVTFCGHRELYGEEEVRTWLRETLEGLILKGARTFYLGGYGAFDRLAASVVRGLKECYEGIDSVLVLVYLDRTEDVEGYDETVYPPLEHVPKRFAIVKRNEWMVERTDVVVACVRYGWGGAASTLDYAKRKGKEIINYYG